MDARGQKYFITFIDDYSRYMNVYLLHNKNEALDVYFAGCVDSCKSTSGYIFMMAGGAISWKSVKQTLTAISTMEAEFVFFF